MRQRINKPFGVRSAVMVCLAVATFVGVACASPNDGDSQSGDKLQVVTTLYPLEYFAKRVGGDMVEVTNLIGPGVEAHDFEPSTGDMRTMSRADVIIYNGLGFEPWMDRAISGLNDVETTVVELGRVIAGRAEPGRDGQPSEVRDPHFWLDPLLAGEQVQAISDALSGASPSHAAEFQQNADLVLADLDTLHEEFLAGLEGCRLSTFVTSHAAFGRLAARYGLEQVSISGLTPEAEPSPGRLAQLTQEIKATGVKYIMTETTMIRGLPETIAQEVGATVLKLHPLESLTPRQAANGETYLSIMRANLESLRTALECPG